jgi:glucokinase
VTYALGIDIGVTNVKVVGVTPAGEVRFRQSFETHAESPDWPAGVKAHLGEQESIHGRAGHVGIAAPGVARADGRSIRWMRGRLAEVQGLDWGAYLGRPAPVVNDAQAALLGEVWQGAARGAANAILFTLGTGVGGAAIVDGRLLRGHLGRAGHLGHVSLDIRGERDIVNTPGSLETFVGNYTIGRRSGGRYRSTHELVGAGQRNDPAARQIWEQSLDALACGIVSMVNVLDPEIVLVGGGIAVAGEALFGPLVARVREIEWSLEGEHVQIVPAQLGEYAGAIGAAWNAMQESEKR